MTTSTSTKCTRICEGGGHLEVQVTAHDAEGNEVIEHRTYHVNDIQNKVFSAEEKEAALFYNFVISLHMAGIIDDPSQWPAHIDNLSLLEP